MKLKIVKFFKLFAICGIFSGGGGGGGGKL